MRKIPPSELIISPQGCIYHLHLKPDQIADTILLVGNPDRVPKVSQYFDSIEDQIQKREFITHTGYYNGKRLTVTSTGIGTDNIDIVVNEMDALVNIDLNTRKIKKDFHPLTFIRLGTTGAMQKEIPVNEYVIGQYGMGLDNLMEYYDYSPTSEAQQLQQAMDQHLTEHDIPLSPYFVKADEALVEQLGEGAHQGITVTAPGFYAPQGRTLRAPLAYDHLNKALQEFSHQQHRITNFEMETSALYGMARLLGHSACTVCAVIANRPAQQFSDTPQSAVDGLIQYVLGSLS